MHRDKSDTGRLLDLVPAGRLEKYLNTVSKSSGLSLRLLDSGMQTLITSTPSSDGTDADPCPQGLWDGIGKLHAEGPGELREPGKGAILSEPVHYKGEMLGVLAVCTRGPGKEYDRARQLLSISSSHIESLVETGYEVESLSAEVVRVYEELALIYGLISRLGAIVDVYEICRVVAEEAAKLLDARDVIVQLADTGAGMFRTVLAKGEHRADAMGFSPGLEEGLVGASYVGHRAIIVCEVDQDKRHTGWPYPVRRFMAVPMMAEGRVIGMLVATDKRDGDEFNTREEKLISAIAAVAAISVKNAQLYTDIKSLLEGFINASVTAVESRDPTTAGHSSRVAYLTVEFAKKVDASDLPVFRGVSFTPEDLMEMHYAGLLHDFGKIGVRESVLLKENKLSDERMETIRERFAYISERSRRLAAEEKLRLLSSGGGPEKIAAIDAALAAELAELDGFVGLVETANNPRVLLESNPELDRLEALTGMNYVAANGVSMPYLSREEYMSLHMNKGSLSEDERREVESHVMHSYNFLNRVPWGKGFSSIVDIVLAHHERQDGSGYPRGIKGPEIPIQAQMMAIADVYDALTAWDRPYKDAVSPQKALFILDMLATDGRLEPHLVQIFRDSGVYKVVADMMPEHGGR